MRRGKRSAGFSAGKAAMLAICSVLVLAATVTATHFVYSGVSGTADPADDSAGVALASVPGSAYSEPGEASGAPGVEYTPTTRRSQPEDLPGIPDPGATQLESTVQDATEPDTQPTDEDSEAEPEDTEATTTAPTTTVPATTTPVTTAPQTTAPASTSPITLNEHGIYSKAALLLDLETGAEIFTLDADKQVYPASLSKMMTAIVVIENNADLDRMVTITEDMLAGLAEAGASCAGFAVGEAVTLSDLLHGLMLPSGADAANAAAVATAGSVDAFVSMMNQKATALGMKSTTFMNTHGLHDAKLVSSCRDLAALLTYALDNSNFRRIFTTATYTTTATEQHPNGIKLSNNMSAALSDNPLKRGRVIGSKTGFTTPAGQCLASLAVIGGREYILITVGAGKSGFNTQRYNMLDAIELYGRIED